MTWHGTVKDGVIIVDGEPSLAEGTKVQIKLESLFDSEVKEIPPLIERYKGFIGIAKDLPSDFARNHDHYIHGTPKVDE